MPRSSARSHRQARLTARAAALPSASEDEARSLFGDLLPTSDRNETNTARTQSLRAHCRKGLAPTTCVRSRWPYASEMRRCFWALDAFCLAWVIGWLQRSSVLTWWLSPGSEQAARLEIDWAVPNAAGQFLMVMQVVTATAALAALPVLHYAGWLMLCDRLNAKDARRFALAFALAGAGVAVLASSVARIGGLYAPIVAFAT